MAELPAGTSKGAIITAIVVAVVGAIATILAAVIQRAQPPTASPTPLARSTPAASNRQTSSPRVEQQGSRAPTCLPIPTAHDTGERRDYQINSGPLCTVIHTYVLVRNGQGQANCGVHETTEVKQITECILYGSDGDIGWTAKTNGSNTAVAGGESAWQALTCGLRYRVRVTFKVSDQTGQYDTPGYLHQC